MKYYSVEGVCKSFGNFGTPISTLSLAYPSNARLFPSACCCEHSDIVELLLKKEADRSIADNDDMLPAQCTNDPNIMALFTS